MAAGQQVFISYQRTDADVARQVRAHLAAAGVRTWMDEYDIAIGAYWPDAVDEGLTASDIVVGILSPDAMASRNVKNEWDWALQNDKRLVLVRVAPTAIPHRYVSINFIDATQGNPTSALDALLVTLGIDPALAQVPQTRYARSGDISIAYQVIGDGPLTIVFVPGFVSNVEGTWEDPIAAGFFRRLATSRRLIMFDKRGTGLSDRVSDIPTINQRIDDVRAIMDAIDCDRAVFVGLSEGGPLATVFATTYPERTTALVLCSSFASGVPADDYPWAPTEAEDEATFARFLNHWDDSGYATVIAPSRANDDAFLAWWGRYARMSASPGAAVAIGRLNRTVDIRHILPSVRVPTLVIHRTGDLMCKIGEGRYLAEHIPGARFVELPGPDHWLWDLDSVADAIDEFLADVVRLT